jgi:hypothetical protein
VSTDPTLPEALEAYCRETGKSQPDVLEDIAQWREFVRWMRRNIPIDPTPESVEAAVKLISDGYKEADSGNS